MEIKYLNRSELKPFPENPRKLSDKDKRDLVNSLKVFGFVEPVVVNSRADGIMPAMAVIGGNQRVFEGSVGAGIEVIPCVMVDMDYPKAKALNIALNKIQGEWDYSKLQQMLTELPADLQQLAGWSGKELEKIMFLFQEENQNLLEGNIDDFAKEVKNHEIRLFIPKGYERLDEVKERVTNLKADFPEVVIKEVM